MAQNKLRLAFRNLKKNKTFSAINILGLSLGMACCFLILLYSWYELNYDNFHKNGDQLYRLEYQMNRGAVRKLSRNPSPVGLLLKDYFPEIKAASRFYPRELGVELVESQKQFELEDVFFVDSSATEIFEFDFLQGNPQTALHTPDAVVITDKTAMQLFGKTDVLGKPIKLAGEEGFRITGVIKAWQDNSHLNFNMLLPFKTIVKVEPPHARENIAHFIKNNWSATYCYTYVKLKPNQDFAKVNERFPNFVQDKVQGRNKDIMSFSLVPIQDIHLLAEGGGPKPSGNLNYLYLFLTIGILTLLIACINFVNLSTASSMTRAKEVGVRKVLGAQRSSLIGQFLGESMLLSFFSFVLSFFLTLLALPYLNQLTGIEIPYASLFHPTIFGTYFLIFLLVGFLAGLYPAFFVSRFKPATVLKGTGGGSTQKAWNDWLRKGLITLQFLAAIVFITGTITIYLQLNHFRNQPLGYNQDLVLSLPLNSGNNINSILRPGDATLRQRMNSFDESLMANPNIKAVTQCSRLPGTGTISQHITTADKPDEEFISNMLSVDYDFFETFELELAAGRDFDASHGTDHTSAFLINEKAIKFLGWEDAEQTIGKQMSLGGKEGQVVGIVKDFHFESLHSEIDPLIMEVRPGSFGHFALRVENENLQKTLGFIEEKWKAAFPNKVFEYTFLDETIAETYQVESRLASIIGYAAFLTIFISCFGLFGLAALLTQHRFKEIGIRKVLGASVNQILGLIAKDFIKLVGIAMLLALPLTWYFLSDWLAEFAYRINFPWWTTLVSGLAVMIIAFLTISAQSIKAALGNPVDAIRDE